MKKTLIFRYLKISVKSTRYDRSFFDWYKACFRGKVLLFRMILSYGYCSPVFFKVVDTVF